MVLLLLSWVSVAAQTSIPFTPTTYSADEGCRWVVLAEAAVPGDDFHLAAPTPDQREHWLAAARAYRDQIRQAIHRLSEVDMTYQGVRAWVRMRPDFARALDLQPGETCAAEIEARWLEGNDELVFALDYHDRRTDAKLGWSMAFSTLRIPRDGQWHRLNWEGTLPTFDATTTWCKLILGMDATQDPSPGHILIRNFTLRVPARAEAAVAPLFTHIPASGALDRTIYNRPDLAWAGRAFVCHFTFMYDLSFFDPAACQFRLDSFLADAEREFGGYDALVLWHAYPRIGVDQRNQFDFYRDMPGGLDGLRQLAARLHERGVKVFLAYNPWDTGTRREGTSDAQALASLLAALDADGLFLDTMGTGSAELRSAVDAARPGVALEPEGSPPLDQLEICSASWAQGFPQNPVPGILRLKWIEPRHMQHQINRWATSHARELEDAFFNGSGMLVWENIFGTWNPWNAADRATLRRAAPLQRLLADHFTSDAWEPFAPTLLPGVYANAWPGAGATVYTLLNRTGQEVTQPVLRVPAAPGARFFDLWRGEELTPSLTDGVAELAFPLGPIGCVAVVSDPDLLRRLETLLPRQRAEAARPLPEPDLRNAAASLVNPQPVPPTPPASADDPPPGMVLIPAGQVTMHLSHQRRECGCYPDPGTPPERWPAFLLGIPFDGTIEHHVGPLALPAYFIDAHEVTNAEYARFLRASGYRPTHPDNFLRHWGGSAPPPHIADHPVVYVDLDDARAYACWAGKRLPTEAEWHRAAQGDDGRTWPWGNAFDASRCNGNGTGATPVSAFPQGRSPFGCYDMSGNVWEWTESERSDGHTRFCIIRGGSWFRAEGSIWYMPGGPQPCTSHAKFILIWPGLDRCSTIGFRCVKDVGP